MYAFVRFLEDNVCYALPVSCVRDFSPRSRLDFDNQKVYAVYRGPEELGAGPESPQRAPRDWGALLLHKAQILALAGPWTGPPEISCRSAKELNHLMYEDFRPNDFS